MSNDKAFMELYTDDVIGGNTPDAETISAVADYEDNNYKGEPAKSYIMGLHRNLDLSLITKEHLLLNLGQIAFDMRAHNKDRIQATKLLIEAQDGHLGTKDFEINIARFLKVLEDKR